MPRVSVVTPVYNRAETLPRTIDSVLEQTFEDFKYLIVDDASTDDTPEVVAAYDDPRVEYLRHETNRRQAAARNTAIERAEGEYLAFVDSDDEWHPEKLERQVDCLDGRDEEWLGVYCDSTTLRNSPLKEFVTDLFPYEIRKEGSEELMRDILAMQGNISAGSSLLVRTEAARAIGGFDETMPRHEDIDFVLRLLRRGKLAYGDEELLLIHESPDPSADLVAESKARLFEKFADDIDRIEATGYPVRKYHHFHLARCYFRDGDFRTGWRHLLGSRASNPRQHLRLIVAVLQGAVAAGRRQLPG